MVWDAKAINSGSHQTIVTFPGYLILFFKLSFFYNQKTIFQCMQ